MACRLVSAIIETNVAILLIGPLEINFSEIMIEINMFFVHENAFQNVVCKIASISSRSQWFNRKAITSFNIDSRFC